MKIPGVVWLLFFIGVGLIAVQAVLNRYRASQEQTRRAEDEEECHFFRTHDSWLVVSIALGSLGGALS